MLTAQRATPQVLYKDLDRALPWLVRVLGLHEVARVTDLAGETSQARLQLEGGTVVAQAGDVGYRTPAEVGCLCSRVIFIVRNVDAHYARAKATGARIVSELEDMPWGLRRYELRDLEGQAWQFNQHMSDVPPRAWGAVSARG